MTNKKVSYGKIVFVACLAMIGFAQLTLSLKKTFDIRNGNDIKKEFIIKKDTVYKEVKKDQTIDFIIALAKSESSLNTNAYNGHYIGLFQFGYMRLKDLGYDYNKIKNKIQKGCLSEREQIEIAIKHFRDYQNRIKKSKEMIKRYDTSFSVASILSTAHLLGFNKSTSICRGDGSIFSKDSNGTTFYDYANKFSKYKNVNFNDITTDDVLIKLSEVKKSNKIYDMN